MQSAGIGPRHRGIYRFLYKRLRLPRPVVHDVLGWWRRRGLAEEFSYRAQVASALPTGSLDLDSELGLRLIGAGENAALMRLAERCQTLYQTFRSSGAAEQQLARNPNKRFLLGVLSGNEFLEHPELLVDMLDRSLLDAAARYLGTWPRLEGAVLWWTPPNETLDSSQQWHIDELAQRQVKILLNCSDVADDCGPLHFLPAARSDGLRAHLGHRRGRVDEDQLLGQLGPQEILKATGPAGSAVMLDSSRCLHFGSRGNQRDRLVLAFHFLPADAPVDTRYHVEPRTFSGPLAELDELQRLALAGLQRARS
ncbi:MAG: hypothetical protein ACXIUM_09415 [Wenzhouxiangella sp.]